MKSPWPPGVTGFTKKNLLRTGNLGADFHEDQEFYCAQKCRCHLFFSKQMAQSAGWLPQTTAPHETSHYSSHTVYQNEKNSYDTRIVNYEKKYVDIQNRSYEPILHPDTLKPMDPNKLQAILKAERESRETSRSAGPVELRISGSWSLGLTISRDGLVQKIHDGTPASRARLVSESRVRSVIKSLFK
jgi:hypothetical protein